MIYYLQETHSNNTNNRHINTTEPKWWADIHFTELEFTDPKGVLCNAHEATSLQLLLNQREGLYIYHRPLYMREWIQQYGCNMCS